MVCALAGAALMCSAAPASASLSTLLSGSSCTQKDALDGNTGNGTTLPFKLCTDGQPSAAGGTTPNLTADSAVEVPSAYNGITGLPATNGGEAVPGENPANNTVALDVDVSLPDSTRFPTTGNQYPVVVFMHGCCSGSKASWEGTTIDPAGAENWHYNNAWFASRGYIVVNYTARGFVDGSNHGSTGETQLDSAKYEINDYQHLVGQLADAGDLDPGSGVVRVAPQRVVPTGGSYGGGFTWLALTDPTWNSPGSTPMKVAAAATKYGWTNLVEALVPRGDDRRDALPQSNPAIVKSTVAGTPGFPKQSINAALYASGKTGVPPGTSHTTFPAEIDDAQACLTAPADPGPANPLCTNTLNNTLPRFIDERSAYFQSAFFSGLQGGSIAPVPVFSAGTFTDKLFPAAEHRRMVERLKASRANYPVQEYYGDYNHFVQTKRKEFADVCGSDHHVCTYDDYPLGGPAGTRNLNANPAGRSLEPGLTSRLNRFVDHYAKPPVNTGQATPAFDVTGALQVCPDNAGAMGRQTDEPGLRFTAPTFAKLAPHSFRFSATGAQSTANLAGDPHAVNSDPVGNLADNGGACPTETSPAGPGVATYDSGALPRTLTMLGQTRLVVTHMGTGNAKQLNARLYDVFPGGKQVMVDRGVKRITSTTGPTTLDLHGAGWRFAAGHKVRLEIAQGDAPYIKPSSEPSSLTIQGVSADIPVREPPPSVGGGPSGGNGGPGSGSGGSSDSQSAGSSGLPPCASFLRATRRHDLSRHRRLRIRVGLRRRSRIAAVVRRRGPRRFARTSRRANAGRKLITLRVSRLARPGRHRLKVRISCAGRRPQTVFRRVRFVP